MCCGRTEELWGSTETIVIHFYRSSVFGNIAVRRPSHSMIVLSILWLASELLRLGGAAGRQRFCLTVNYCGYVEDLVVALKSVLIRQTTLCLTFNFCGRTFLTFNYLWLGRNSCGLPIHLNGKKTFKNQNFCSWIVHFVVDLQNIVVELKFC